MEKVFDYSVRRCQVRIILPYSDFRYSCGEPSCYWIKDGGRSFPICKEHFEKMKSLGKIGAEEVI